MNSECLSPHPFLEHAFLFTMPLHGSHPMCLQLLCLVCLTLCAMVNMPYTDLPVPQRLVFILFLLLPHLFALPACQTLCALCLMPIPLHHTSFFARTLPMDHIQDLVPTIVPSLCNRTFLLTPHTHYLRALPTFHHHYRTITLPMLPPLPFVYPTWLGCLYCLLPSTFSTHGFFQFYLLPAFSQVWFCHHHVYHCTIPPPNLCP